VAGYSATPLSQKLGIKPGMIIRPVHSPNDYALIAGPLPEDTRITTRDVDGIDLVHLFTKERTELLEALVLYKQKIKQAGMIWVSWPKKSSGMTSELTEDVIREIALPLGLVDIKVCAVDHVWSGLKLVIRKKNRE
jgi:Protein of unknown function (DUF3052)